MGYEELVRTIETGVRQTCEEILQKAEQEALRIRREAEQEAKSLREEARKETELRIRQEQKLLLNRAHLEVQRETLHVRNAYIKEVMQEVWKQLRDLCTQPRYEEIFEALVVEATNQLEGPVAFRVATQDESLCRRVVQKLGISATVEPSGNFAGGVQVSNSDASLRIVNTFQSRLARCHSEVMTRVADFLATAQNAKDKK